MPINKQRTTSASITVFLTLILLLITALLCTTVEAARIQGAKGMSKVFVNASMDSIFSTYQRELYDNYRIFGYDMGENIEGSREEQTAKVLEGYIEEIQNSLPQSMNKDVYEGLNKLGNFIDWYNLQIDDISVSDVAMLTDYKGKIFLNEVLEFMKYSAPMELVTELLDKWNLYDSSEETTTVMNKKLKTQEAVGSLSKDMLALMAKVEGVKTDKNGVTLTKSNTVKVHKTFAKKVVTNQPTMESVRINNPIIYDALKGNYFNVDSEINSIITNCKDAIKCNYKIVELDKNKDSLKEEQEKLKITVAEQAKQKEEAAAARARALEGKKKKGKDNDNDDNDNDGYTDPGPSTEELRLDEIEKALKEIEKEKKELEIRRDNDVKESNKSNILIDETTRSTVDRIGEACEIIDRIEQKSHKVGEQVEDYEAVVEENKDKLNIEQYKEFQDNIIDMKEYIGLQVNKDEFSAASAISMREPLQGNKLILQEVNAQSQINVTSDNGTLSQIIDGYMNQQKNLQRYSITELRFDYSSLKLEHEVDSPVSKVTDLLRNGVLELVVKDSSRLSNAKINMDQYPSKQAAIEAEQDMDCTAMLDGCEDNEYNSKITDTFTMDNSVVNDLATIVLLNQYQTDYFKDYVEVSKSMEEQTETNPNANKTSKEEGDNTSEVTDSNEKKGSVEEEEILQYEREYMLIGKSSDKANLASFATRLIILRTIFNFIYIFTNKEKTSYAYTTAVGIVGFTCLQPLIELVKVIVLFVWALEEAIVDTNALFSGYKVPLIKSKATFKVRYTDLLTFNKATIQSLANQYAKETTSLGSFTYSNYLRVFLLLNSTEKNCFRTMDMIQMNMQAQLDSDFKLSNCLFGMRAVAGVSIPEKMITLPFITKMIGNTGGRYTFHIEQSNAY